MTDFIFLYRGGEQAGSPEQMQKTMQAWMTWMQELGKQGHLKDRGQPLERTGKMVTGKQKAITDGPYPESKDIVGGFSIVQARDLEHAAELSRGCPIFEMGGGVEVRPIRKMDM